MVELTVTRAFRDLKEHVDRNPGDVFDATEERAAEIDAALPGYVTIGGRKGDELDGMTATELRALAESRGIEVPKGARKTQIVQLLRG